MGSRAATESRERRAAPGEAGPRVGVWSLRPLTAPDPPRPTRRGPLGLEKGGPLPMCCVSSCTAGISFRGMCPVPPSLQHRRQQNTEAAITPGPPTRPPPLAAGRPKPAVTPPLRLRSASRPCPSAGGICVERADRYSDAPRREGAVQAEVKPACAEDAEDLRVGRGGVEKGAGLEAEQGQRAGRAGRAGRRRTACACARGRFFLRGASSLSSYVEQCSRRRLLRLVYNRPTLRFKNCSPQL